MKRFATLATTVALLLGATGSLTAAPVVLRGGTVHPISSPPIENGEVIFGDGVILRVGPSDPEGRPAPHDAIVVDVTGKHVWPALIDAFGFHGLTEVGSVRGTLDRDEAGGMNPGSRAEIAINASSSHFPVSRSNGVLLALTAPSGGLVAGTAAAIALDGWTSEELVRHAPAGLVIQWPVMKPADGDDERPAWEGEVARLDRMIEEARAYGRARAEGRGSRGTDVQWESLLGVISGDVPLWIRAATLAQIRAALDWTERQGLRLVLVAGDSGTGSDAWRCADELAARGVAVVVQTTRRPRRTWEPYDTAYAEPARLQAAGVRIAFGSWNSAHSRGLPQEAARAAAFGLPRDAAMRALTLDAARVLGIDLRYGSLEPGKSATLLVTDDDVLELRMNVERAWLDGRELDLDEDPQKQLRQKWSRRPAAEDPSQR